MPPPPPPRTASAEVAYELSKRTKRKSSWRWRDLWVFGAIAFGIPEGMASSTRVGDLSSFLDSMLVFQLLGYVLAVALAFYMIRRLQGGDWATLGIQKTHDMGQELLWGIGFGVLLFAAFVPIGMALNGGAFETGGIVNVLIGNTSGIGLLMAAVVVVIGAPIVEEIYYRGLLYEKLAARSRWLAVIVTTLVFTAAHGALIIPSIMLVGLGLAVMRSKRSLWFTMAAHATWNFIIICLAAVTLTGSAVAYEAPGGAFRLSHSKEWKETEVPAEFAGAVGTLDLALESTTGSLILALEVPLVGGSTERTLNTLVAANERMGMTYLQRSPVAKSPIPFRGLTEAYETTYKLAGPGMTVDTHMVLVRPHRSQVAYSFGLVCPQATCADDEADFVKLLETVTFP